MAIDQARSSLELLYHISRELASDLELRTLLYRVLYLSLNSVGGERGSVIVVDDQGLPIESAIVYGAQLHNNTTQQLRDTLDKGLAGWVTRHRKAALIPDTSKDDRWLRRPDDAIDRSGAKAALCLPLMVRERLVGVLTLVHPTPGSFTEEHLALMQAISDQASVAVLNARLYTDSQRQARVMTALAENAVTINASLKLEEVLQRILEQTRQALRVEVVFLGLIDPASGEVAVRAATGKDAPNYLGLRRPFREGLVGRVIQEGRAVAATANQFTKADLIPGLDMNAFVCAPVRSHGRIIGMLQAIKSKDGSIDPDAVLVLTGIGGLAGTAIQNAQLYEELQVTNQRYRELFDSHMDPIFITDHMGRILLANRQAAQSTGIAASALQGHRIQEIHTPDLNCLGEHFELVPITGTVDYESTMHAVNRTERPVEAHISKVNFEGTDCLQWMLRDITQQKELDQMRSDLVAMIYHDLRSPLANVVSSLDILTTLLPEEANPSVGTVVKIATRSTERIQRMVSSLLDIDRLEAGQAITNRVTVDPEELIHDAVEAVKTTTDNKRQTLETELTASLPNIWIDQDMIRRVLINLLENASKYSPDESQIRIGAEKIDGALRVKVEDNGPGIPPQERENVFNKYTRLRTANSPKGMGLGLAFCRLAVEAHGGKIWVEGRAGPGSSFCFTLPVQDMNETGS